MAIKFLADENLQRLVIRALMRRVPDLDIVRVQEVNLAGFEDEEILAWAAMQERVLLTRDCNTIPKFAYERLQANLPMTGVIVIHDGQASIGQIIEDILLLAEFSEECVGQVRYVPL